MTTASPTIDVADYILVGGGLQNALILLALAARKPAASILLLEREATLGGNHLWSFQARDVPDSAWEWMEPLVEYCWAGYQLNFAASSRWVAGAYRSLSSEHLAQIVAQTVENKTNIQIMTHAAVTRCDPQRVTLADGRIFQGRLIIDARGPDQNASRRGGGYQKFVGLECQLRQPITMNAPLLMDTRCPQYDGFRFHYVLPFAPDRVLIEDTYFSNNPTLDVDTISVNIIAEAGRLGLAVERVLRSEVGVLPMPALSTFHPRNEGVLHAGYAGGWFNPGTGYSLAAAVRLAEHLSTVALEDVYGKAWRQLVRKMRIQSHFLAFLNLMMFGLFHDKQRAKLMERFYLVSDDVIHRFFAMDSTALDMWKIMWVGAPWTPKGRSKRATAPQ
ncbi:lycopene cyclase [Chromatium okenii]|uniref:lycopene beta-cyclase CrtY n=1 Tax=Chromatium okenii TaxID=61644 RepID=UPI001908E110|nr:lycopene beta-cyclase CrtY [Chromatium okenii]MBK1642096.1 lycopene cyclase [Chromatium okenii]